MNVAQIEQDFKTLLEGIKTSEETVMAGKGEGLEALQVRTFDLPKSVPVLLNDITDT